MLWWTPNIVKFLAASKNYIYGLNSIDQIVKLDPESGVPVQHFSAVPFDIELFNIQSDRLYLITRQGLVQCLRETALEEPLRHRYTKKEIAEAEARLIEERKKAFTGGAPKVTPEEETPEPGGADPFAQPAAPDTGNPFDMGGSEPAPGTPSEPAADDQADPFGSNPFGENPFGEGSGGAPQDSPQEEEEPASDANPFGNNPFGQ
jgi:hypothetical protein